MSSFDIACLYRPTVQNRNIYFQKEKEGSVSRKLGVVKSLNLKKKKNVKIFKVFMILRFIFICTVSRFFLNDVTKR